MRQLFAPWRMAYIGGEPEPGCLFCRVLAAPPSEDAPNLVVARPPGTVVMLNKFPYNNGHLLVAPATHTGALDQLGGGDAGLLMAAVQTAVAVLRAEMSPEGFNVGVNQGSAAGAGIPDHVHFHVVPRWGGDTNFMPVLGETKVINEHLDQTRQKLAAAFSAGGR